MANFNQVVLCGHLTRDVELRKIGENQDVAGTNIAVNRVWNDRATGEKKSKTMFIDLAAFGNLATLFGNYLKKGSNILVEGELEYQTWEKDGQKHSKHSVLVNRMQMLDKKDSDRAAKDNNLSSGGSFTDSDIPF